jgi:peptidoglycan/xylan/chitin deacetylase (PgdA/CDA1 family)
MFVMEKRLLVCFVIVAFLWLACDFSILGMYWGERWIPTFSPIRKGVADYAGVSLMFNVDWGAEYIPAILDLLKERNIKVTFFLTGSWALDNPELTQRMFAEGHEVGNHGGYHDHVEGLSKEKFMELIEQGEQMITESGGSSPSKLFAPPYGEWTDATVKYASEKGYKTILWSADTVDWKIPPPETIWKRALDGAEPGSFILMHPTQPTLEALPVILDGLAEKNLLVVTVSQNLMAR